MIRPLRPLPTLGVMALLCGALAFGLDLAFARDVTLLLSPRSDVERAEWRQLRDPLDDLAEIYGQPVVGGPERVVLFRGDADPRVIRPVEAPERTLLIADGGDVRSARRLELAGFLCSVLGVLLLLAWTFGQRRAAYRARSAR